MDINSLKPYNKYKDINKPNAEYIYIGVDKNNNYLFLYKNKFFDTPFFF